MSLGTAQLSRYGVANGQGQISYDEAVTSLKRRWEVWTLDTAVSYGVAERVLGELALKILTVTKPGRYPKESMILMPGLLNSCLGLSAGSALAT